MSEVQGRESPGMYVLSLTDCAGWCINTTLYQRKVYLIGTWILILKRKYFCLTLLRARTWNILGGRHKKLVLRFLIRPKAQLSYLATQLGTIHYQLKHYYCLDILVPLHFWTLSWDTDWVFMKAVLRASSFQWQDVMHGFQQWWVVFVRNKQVEGNDKTECQYRR